MEPREKIIELRQLLAERFPHLPKELKPLPGSAAPNDFAGVSFLDHLDKFPRGALVEWVASSTSSGSASLLCALIEKVAENRQRLALIDGRDSFDPAALEASVLSHLLWVRCTRAIQAIQAADLLVRDGNLPWVILDLRLNPSRELRKIPATSWYRMQRLLDSTSMVLFTITPHRLVSSARICWSVRDKWDWEALTQPRDRLLQQLEPELVRSPSGSHANMAEVG